jgi:hypothetical protein
VSERAKKTKENQSCLVCTYLPLFKDHLVVDMSQSPATQVAACAEVSGLLAARLLCHALQHGPETTLSADQLNRCTHNHRGGRQQHLVVSQMFAIDLHVEAVCGHLLRRHDRVPDCCPAWRLVILEDRGLAEMNNNLHANSERGKTPSFR